MSTLKIAILQMDIKTGSLETNKKTVDRLMEGISLDTDIVMLPEMWSVGFDFNNMQDHGSNWQAAVDYLRTIAINRRSMVVGGSIPEKIGDHLFNSVFVIDNTGEVVDRYWKMHLVSHNNLEGIIFDRGDRIPTFSIKDIPFGVANCYDLRFPELFRGIALNGSKVIFLVAQFPHPLYQHWITLLRARAIENQIFVVAANRVGKNYFGHSVAISPTGEIIFEGGGEEGVYNIEIDTGEVDSLRARRNDLEVMNHFAYNKKVYKSNFIGVGGLVERNGKILMVRQNHSELKDTWVLPGGHVEKGERLDTAVEREVLEETGIRAKSKGIFAIRTKEVKGVTDCYIVMLLEYISGEPKADGFENNSAKFFSREEINTREDINHLPAEIAYNYFDNLISTLEEQGNFILNSDTYKLYLPR